MPYVVTRTQLRKLVFETSVAYCRALIDGKPIQEAERVRKAKLDACIKELPPRRRAPGADHET